MGRWKLHFPHAYRTLGGRKGGTDGIPVPYGKANIDLALFDLDNDIGETKDVKDEHPDVVATMQKLADQMRQDLGDSARKMQGSGRRPAGQLEAADARYVVKDGVQTLVKPQ